METFNYTKNLIAPGSCERARRQVSVLINYKLSTLIFRDINVNQFEPINK